MKQDIKDIVTDCMKGSDEERHGFAEVVSRLRAAGVERYHADLSRATKTFYMPDGDAAEIPSRAVKTVPAAAFSASGVDAAVRAIQRREIGYREFCERIAGAGCVGYVVSLPGSRTVYYGRTGDLHIENFPRAA